MFVWKHDNEEKWQQIMTESSQVCEANIIFDDGSKCSWAGRISCGSNTTYSLILRSFVSYYNASNNKALDINE